MQITPYTNSYSSRTKYPELFYNTTWGKMPYILSKKTGEGISLKNKTIESRNKFANDLGEDCSSVLNPPIYLYKIVKHMTKKHPSNFMTNIEYYKLKGKYLVIFSTDEKQYDNHIFEKYDDELFDEYNTTYVFTVDMKTKIVKYQYIFKEPSKDAIPIEFWYAGRD